MQYIKSNHTITKFFFFDGMSSLLLKKRGVYVQRTKVFFFVMINYKQTIWVWTQHYKNYWIEIIVLEPKIWEHLKALFQKYLFCGWYGIKLSLF